MRLLPMSRPPTGLPRAASLLLGLLLPGLLVAGCGDKEEEETGEACVPEDEVCNGRDDDCDGEIDEDVPTSTWYADADLDGYGTPDSTLEACSQPAGHVSNALDCDDADDAVNPDGRESCNDKDDDCDGLVDANDSDVNDAVEYFNDADGDGWGRGDASLRACEAPEGTVTEGGDCDDTDAAVHPEALEICNEIDDDCDGLVDFDDADVEAPEWYPDEDGDGYGAEDGAVQACDLPSGDWTDVPGDCDDADSARSPGLAEVCRDGVDNDCDGTANDCEPIGGSLAAVDDADVHIYGGYYGFGVHVRSGDLTGDGQPDLVVSCTGMSTVAGNSGGAYIFEAPARGSSITSADARSYLTSRTSAENLGSAMDLGDVDGDGFLDVALTTNSPELRVFMGPVATGGDAAADIEITGADYSGTDLTTVGLVDLEGRGEAAIVLADIYGDTTYGNAGIVAVITAPDDGGDVQDLARGMVTGADTSDYFGWAVRGGDMDGDGIDDLVMTTRLSDTYGAFVASGDEVLDTVVIYSDLDRAFVDSSRSRGYFGYAVSRPADVDGDGHADLAVGAPYDTTHGAGSVYLLLGPLEGRVDASAADGVAWTGATSFGRQVDSVPDMDGDGAAELLIGSYAESETGTGEGGAFLFYGGWSGTLDAAGADAIVSGTNTYEYVGYGVAGLDDVDGDGMGEIAVAQYGTYRLSLFFGGAL